MLHLLKYSFLSKIRNFNIVFWPLVFPLVLGTFFYFAFGNINEADFQTVPVAVVKEASADTFFMTYLDEVEKSSPDLLKAEEMSEKEALEALQDKKVEGIYYVGKEPSLTVAGTGIEESILFLQKPHSLRSGYCHLCACVNIQIREIPAYKRKYSQILYDHRIQTCLIIWKQIFKQLIIQFTVLQKCIHSKI